MIDQTSLLERVSAMQNHALSLISIGAGDIEIVISEDGGSSDVHGETLSSDEDEMLKEIETAVYAHALAATTIHQGEYNIDDLDPDMFGDLRSEMIDSFKALFGTPAIDFRGDLNISIQTTTTFGVNVS